MPLKFLDYGKPYPFGGIIGRPYNLAWPVNTYRVTLPKSDSGDGLNMFERVVLKIIDACGTREANALAQEICIPVDLVKFILLRLRDKAIIDENNEILKQGRDKWMIKEEKEPVFITALVFRELATGKILPFLHLLDNEKPLRKREEDEKFFRTIRWHNNYMNKKPDPHDIILVLQAMKKRSSIFGNYPRLPAIEQIIIADESEQYHLDCPIAIQKSDSEFRIADPFGNGFSLLLENSFFHLLEQNDNDNLGEWLNNWKQRLSNPAPKKPSKTPKEPFDNDTNRGRYRNLIYNLRCKQDTQYRSIEQIHSALEWALFYACIQRQYDATIKRLRLMNPVEQTSILKEAAKKIRLDSPQNGFYPVPDGKLDDFLDGKAEMATVISVMLLMAENDQSHPLHKIANRHQDFITRLFNIKKKRDEQGHGKGKAQKKDVELPEDAFMRKIVSTLLPDISFTDTPIAAADKDFVADVMLDSRASIQNEFGFKQFNQLGIDLQERLIYAERFWLSCKGEDDACAFVFDLYAALQAMFRKKLTGILPPDINDSDFIERAQAKATKAKLGELPESLRTVKPRMILQTLQGDDQSLGACVVAFLLVLDEDNLEKVSENQPSFISDIADIIFWRAHGNEPVPMKKDGIEKIRKSAYLTIKTLLEV